MTFNGQIDAIGDITSIETFPGRTVTRYQNEGLEVDFYDFTVMQDSQVRFDTLSGQVFAHYLSPASTAVYAVDEEGGLTLIGEGTFSPELDCNGSVTGLDTTLDVFLPTGSYTVAISTTSSFSPGLDLLNGAASGVLVGPEGVTSTFGEYQLDIHGDFVSLTGQCPCELDGEDDQVDILDLLVFLDLWLSLDTAADFNGGGIDITDLLDFLTCWFTAANAPCA